MIYHHKVNGSHLRFVYCMKGHANVLKYECTSLAIACNKIKCIT